jgi:EAL domain-containing protein (putative c-di-GMP-specific phosphodiesterase class I)
MINQTRYNPGAVIFEQGAVGDCAYIIEQGLVEISVQQDGEKIVLALLAEGDIFGEMALVSGDLRSASARALVATNVSVISQSVFRELLAHADPIVPLMMKVLLQRFQESQAKLLSMPIGYMPQLKRIGERADTQEMERRETMQRFRFINDLQAALRGGQMQLHYQPIINLQTGVLAGFEALVRWNHPTHGMISPSDFIRIAEETMEIVPIGYWIFETACSDLKKLRDAAGADADSPTPWMSINVSSVQFRAPDLLTRFVEILTRIGLPPGTIKIELTESALVDDPRQMMLFLHEVRRLGMKVAVDDFGTGYSSLSYLHLFPVDTLKIDNSFVANMFRDTRSRQIVHAIIVLSKNLNIDIIAEGIEDRELEDLISHLGCRYGQGYLYSRPVACEQAFALLGQSFKT